MRISDWSSDVCSSDLDGGSTYWVIKGEVQVRQRLVEIRPFTDDEGIKCCALVLDPDLVETESLPRGPFPGWRSFPAKDAPHDLHAPDALARPPALPSYFLSPLLPYPPRLCTPTL